MSTAAPSRPSDVPVWHFAMVNDVARNEAIERSIAALDLAGRTVVEIGAGTGLIALLFARHGAARIVSCEVNPAMADVAREVVVATPYADRITIVDGSSTDAIRRGVFPCRPDVIFTETLDCGVVGEGFVAIAHDIATIAGPRTIVMPRAVRQFATLVESEGLADLDRATSACGFDLRALNRFATATYVPVRVELHGHRFLSAPRTVRTYGYVGSPRSTSIAVRAEQAGTVHGVLTWFSADFGAAAVTSAPASGSHWHQAFHPLPREVAVGTGDLVTIRIDDTGRARLGTSSDVRAVAPAVFSCAAAS
ncbi:MAG: ribonucleotide-diphosphate reductase subunit beta [Ilumatobacteraceae bacterium]